MAVALLHSKPYDSPARGKIERFWRTVRDGFLPLVPTQRQYSLEQFNQLFADWLDKLYHLKRCGRQQSPFSESAIEAIFKNTAGVPRLIESLAIKTMTVGMHAKTQTLTEEQVYQAAKEL